MLLAIDAGNTNIVFAVYDGDTRVAVWRCKTESSRTADEYASFLLQMFTLSNLSFSQVTGTIISSVVPEANFHLAQLCQSRFSGVPMTVGHADVDFEIKLKKPEEVGADRLVNAVAVRAFYKYPAIVVDFGTATTFDVVDKTGAYCGGVIAPGINLSMDALHRAAAKLPKTSIKKPASVIGTDTTTAMQSGIYWGYISLIEGMITRISDEMGVKPFVIATGGLSSLFAGGTKMIDKVDEDLILRGLVRIYDMNRKVRAA